MHQNMHRRVWPDVDFGLIQYKSFILMVPGGGVEPPRGCPRRILSPLRLPVPPSRRKLILLYLALWTQAAELVCAGNCV